MSSAAKVAANQANAQLSTGPRSDAGRAISSKNATKSGLFAANDFILPGEEGMYDQLDEGLGEDLAPIGYLELTLVDEIRRVMWRLRRCGIVESSMVPECAEAGGDPIQFEATAKLQHSVDRSRAQCHRILRQSMGELRKLQTERQIRNETLEEGTDLSGLGLSDSRTVTRAVQEQTATHISQKKLNSMNNDELFEAAFNQATAIPMDLTPAPAPTPTSKPMTKPTQMSRNSRCFCGSGLKYKRCCALKAVALAQAA